MCELISTRWRPGVNNVTKLYIDKGIQDLCAAETRLSANLQNLGTEERSQHALKWYQTICSLITVSKLIISKAHEEDTS